MPRLSPFLWFDGSRVPGVPALLVTHYVTFVLVWKYWRQETSSLRESGAVLLSRMEPD